MPSTDVQDDSIDAGESDSSEQLFDFIGIASAVGQLVAFGAIGFTALDSIPYGVVAGAMTGAGSYLFLPWFFRLSAAGEGEEADQSFAALVDEVDGDPSRAVFGLGLDLGGVIMIAVGFVLDEPVLLIGAGAGVAWALVVYLVGTVWLDRVSGSTP